MSFNTFPFIYFFLLVYGAYRLMPWRGQNLLLLVASLYFYGTWDSRFLFLMMTTIAIDYCCARMIDGSLSQIRRRTFLCISLAANLGVLGFFKYFDFFATQLSALAGLWGISLGWPVLRILLPVGISFYTFQAISYVVDVYKRRLPAEKNVLDFALFIAFFPQLVAGPIERATDLLPQIKAPRHLGKDAWRHGIMLILYGFFKKLVVADNLSPFVAASEGGVGNLSGGAIYLQMLAMTVFIYADFSGYSDIARGLARLLGFNLSMNFRTALFSGDPADFWRRWHITLTRWFRDYVFWPLYRLAAPKNRTRAYAAASVLVCFALSGLWHGAAWNFVVFGLYHGLLLLVYHFGQRLFRRYGEKRAKALGLLLPLAVLRHVLFFHLLSFACILFFVRVPSEWPVIIWRFLHPGWGDHDPLLTLTLGLVSAPLLLIDAAIERYSEERTLNLKSFWQLGFGMALLAGILLCAATEINEFVYFHF